ncbi:type II toxin-antitoxin system VapC family toxin [Enterovirga rhinocerotis]|uniref:Ribonuclease VapC n=1 Tax=Enterovirga rhinocerotis TaxID=1339210 RepID=A0A4R7C817_9HYPH|nr:type II toxin-antitoxin system VapC family toxin [Enterovirga rhinocerotis]TDR93405.1 ribonuclease VapC [Enterovirga rhinocerotis]
MIVVDTSALVAIAFEEPDGDRFSDAIIENGAFVGTPVLVETSLVLRSRMAEEGDLFLDGMLAMGELVVEPFTASMYLAAREAFARYGRGSGHPARLNFGDCLSYAVAKVLSRPLLFKGEDFPHTDIVPALSR